MTPERDPKEIFGVSIVYRYRYRCRYRYRRYRYRGGFVCYRYCCRYRYCYGYRYTFF